MTIHTDDMSVFIGDGIMYNAVYEAVPYGERGRRRRTTCNKSDSVPICVSFSNNCAV